jgi:hypothetical protein
MGTRVLEVLLKTQGSCLPVWFLNHVLVSIFRRPTAVCITTEIEPVGLGLHGAQGDLGLKAPGYPGFIGYHPGAP